VTAATTLAFALTPTPSVIFQTISDRISDETGVLNHVPFKEFSTPTKIQG